jgi:glyoxylase-like metal-dependent hydrolase (beta-lactamase superfamily II)
MPMHLPGPFDIQRVQESEWPGRAVDFLLIGVSREDFLATQTARDGRFVNVSEGLLRMSFHSFVVRTSQGVLLVDTCVGNHKQRPMLAEWHLQTFPYLDRLRQVGLSPADIDFVCCTHLHADHVGWNTQLENGRWRPTFPNARYLFAEKEIDFWEKFHADTPGTPYERAWKDSILPVAEAGLIDRVASDHEIMSGIRLRHAPGHTPGNIVIDLDDGKQSAVLSGDVIHHPVQIERPEWSSHFDKDPIEARQTRLQLLERLADTDTWVMGAHFAAPTALRIARNGTGFGYK